ncbi:hypothetical protein [Promicromonospora sp. NPDC023805]|uniref:DUF7694 domain-containing protein n=1 Tax=Promicromonospora sp. NPDC023805 TaxID=3154696 RepID=UPI0033C011EE
MIPSGPGTSVGAAQGILWTRLREVPTLAGMRGYEARVLDGELHAIVSHEPTGWHLSVSFQPHPGAARRLPSWDELKDARYRFLPDRAHMAALLPPRAEWVDVHPTTLHLWEMPAATVQAPPATHVVAAEAPREPFALIPPTCGSCGRERGLQDPYDYNPIQALTGYPLGWYSGDDGEICPQCMTELTTRWRR